MSKKAKKTSVSQELNTETQRRSEDAAPSSSLAVSAPLKEGEDFYMNDQGLMVFTAKYHLKRGYCCESGCKHCPYPTKRHDLGE